VCDFAAVFINSFRGSVYTVTVSSVVIFLETGSLRSDIQVFIIVLAE